VNGVLKGALVEVHFCLKHYRIKDSKTGRVLDSFTGLVQQIIILKDPVPKQANDYKRKNMLDGPFRPKPFQAQINPSTSTLPTPPLITASTITPAILPLPAHSVGLLPANSNTVPTTPQDSHHPSTIDNMQNSGGRPGARSLGRKKNGTGKDKA